MNTISKNNIEFLELYRATLETEFQKLLEISDFAAKKLLAATSYSVIDSGKRIRPILSLLTAEAIINYHSPEKKLSIENLQSNPALAAALAIELVHCGSLVHDDLPCMDNDDLRRGRPSNHKRFGEATALLVGDLLLSMPTEVLVKYASQQPESNAESINNAIIKLSQAITSMIVGQSLDMDLADELSRKQILNELDTKKKIHKTDLLRKASELKQNTSLEAYAVALMESLKTGAMLKASIEIAAILAGASEKQSTALIHYAENLGLAFQIIDDVLDYSSSTEKLGKTANKDTEQNKLTFVKIYGLEKSRRLAKDLIEEAKDKILQIDIYADKLCLIADYVVSRTH